MTDIEDRNLVFKSWKKYATFLLTENRQLQQLLPTKDVNNAFYGTCKKLHLNPD